MIENVLVATTTEQQPSSAPAFMVDSPTLNPFVAPRSVILVKSAGHFDLEWADEQRTALMPSAIELAEEFVARSRQEAERHSS